MNNDDTMVFTVDLRSITVEVFQEVDALLAEIEREREQGPTFHTGGIVPPCPDVLARLIVDGVVSRHLAETLGTSAASTYDELREIDRALARRIGKRSSRPRVTAREVAERLEITSKTES